jgi:hypothetical protein
MNTMETYQKTVLPESKPWTRPRELFLQQTAHGTLALFEDSLHLRNGILSTEFWSPEKHMRAPTSSGFRKCYTIQVDDQRIFVKPKRSNKKTTLISDLQSVVKQLHTFPENLTTSNWYKLLTQDIRIRNASISALHEILLLEEIKTKYIEAYGELLPIEEAVGAFISRDQKRFTLYKEVPGAIADSQTLHHDNALLKCYHNWINTISTRITGLGYVIGDLQALCIQTANPDETNFVLIDTESWHRTSTR